MPAATKYELTANGAVTYHDTLAEVLDQIRSHITGVGADTFSWRKGVARYAVTTGGSLVGVYDTELEAVDRAKSPLQAVTADAGTYECEVSLVLGPVESGGSAGM